MPDLQRIFVVTDAAGADDLERVRRQAGRAPVVLTAPTGDAQRVVGVLGATPHVEVALAPVRFPPADRGRLLDTLVRSHATHDRFRDVVVVTDAASAVLLLRVLAPDQLASGGAVTTVGLPRPGRPTDLRRAAVGGGVLGAVGGVVLPGALLLGLLAAMVVAGLVLLPVTRWRHLGSELLVATAVAVGVGLFVVAGSTRFPGSW